MITARNTTPIVIPIRPGVQPPPRPGAPSQQAPAKPSGQSGPKLQVGEAVPVDNPFNKPAAGSGARVVKEKETNWLLVFGVGFAIVLLIVLIIMWIRKSRKKAAEKK